MNGLLLVPVHTTSIVSPNRVVLKVALWLVHASRVFSVGSVIYGATLNDLHQEIVNMDEAVSALTKIKVEGGPGAISYKNYDLPSRFVRIINLRERL